MFPVVDLSELDDYEFASNVQESVDAFGIVVLTNGIFPSLARRVHDLTRDLGESYSRGAHGICHHRTASLQMTINGTSSSFYRLEVKRSENSGVFQSELDFLLSSIYDQMDLAVFRVFDALLLSSDALIESNHSGLSLLAYRRPEGTSSNWGDLEGHIDGHNIVTCHAMASDASYWARLSGEKTNIALKPDQLMISFGSLASDYGFEPVHHGITIPEETEYREAIVAFYQ